MANEIQPAPHSKFLFLKQFLSRPAHIGSIVPSSKRLARLMVKTLDAGAGEKVVELGPGTGVFTAELLRQGVLPKNLILVEYNADFAGYLRSRFPEVMVIEGDAGQLPKLLEGLGLGKVSRVISGIPMRSLSQTMRDVITKAIADALNKDGVLVQFTYAPVGPMARGPAQAGSLIGRRTGAVLSNIPPAFVWRYVKAA
jgi:phosphatidylethanolamine/phosphatidyl-N-methylethanolamine N-methyltransferase